MKSLRPFFNIAVIVAIALLLCVPVTKAADTKGSALTELAVAPAEADVLYIIDGGVSKKITSLNFLNALEAALTGYEIHADNLPAPDGTGTDDQTAAEVTSTATGNIVATDVDSAIAELEAEKLPIQTIGIANDNLLEVDDADAADNDYAKITAAGIEGRSYAEVRTDLSIEQLADCSGITGGFCMDTDNGYIYAWDGDSVEEVARPGSVDTLADPDADRIIFWDDGESAHGLLAPDGTTVEISGTTLQVKADGIDSPQYAAASIDNEHLADNAVGNDEMADNAVTYLETTGSSKALTPVIDAAADFAANFTGANLYGGTFICDVTGTIQLPAVAAGMHFSIITKGAIAVSADTNASDLMWLDGVPLDDGDKATNGSAAGDIIVFQYMDATGWVATSNGWTDGGA